MSKKPKDPQVEMVREFNRFYIQRMGLLSKNLSSNFTLTEIRILHEIYVQKTTTAKHIMQAVELDGGYLSRLLQRFEKADLIAKEKAAGDGRQKKIALTGWGTKKYIEWSQETERAIRSILDDLAPPKQARLLSAMGEIIILLT